MTAYANWAPTRAKILILAESQNWRCCYCGIRVAWEIRDGWNSPSCEHVKSLNKGGLRVWENEVMACKLCNNGRSSMNPYRYLKLVEKLGRWKAFKHANEHRRKLRESSPRKLVPKLPAMVPASDVVAWLRSQ